MKVFRTSGRRLAGRVLSAWLCVGVGFAGPQSGATVAGLRELTDAAQFISVGDYERARLLLEPLAPKLAGDPATRPRAVQAYVLLATAQVALGISGEAKASFIAALKIDRGIRLTGKENSPKVVLAFNDALAEFRSTQGSSRTGVVVAAGVVAAGAAGFAARSGSDSTMPSLTNLRFTTPVVTCPDGAVSFPLVVGLAGDLTAPGPFPVSLDAVQITLVITTSPGLPSEVGFSSSMPSAVSPENVSVKSASLTFSTTLVCGNGTGDAPRVNEFLARISLATARGLVTAETADRMRVNIP